MDTVTDLTDAIYEAAFVPDQWSSVLTQAARASGSAAGAMLVFSRPDRPPRYKTTPLTEDALREHIGSGEWMRGRTAEVPRMHGRDFSDFAPTNGVAGPAVRDSDSVTNRLGKIGLDAQVGTFIPMMTGERVMITFERWARDGAHAHADIDRLNSLRPHFARASLLAARMGLEQAGNLVTTMEALRLPAAVLSASGRVMATNPRFDAIAGVFAPTAHGGLRLEQPGANDLLQDCLTRPTGSVDAVRSIAVARRDDGPALVIHVVPLKRAAHEIFSGGDFLVVANEVIIGGEAPSINLLRGLFDLTPAEARIAASLASGQSLREAAEGGGIKFSTSRSYLERVFAKTGTHQQSQLVALLQSAHLRGQS